MIDILIERFYKKIDKQPNGCWQWQGWKNGDGYGFFRYFNKKEIQAHRFSAKHLAGLNIEEANSAPWLNKPVCDCGNKPLSVKYAVEPNICSGCLKPVIVNGNAARSTKPVAS